MSAAFSSSSVRQRGTRLRRNRILGIARLIAATIVPLLGSRTGTLMQHRFAAYSSTSSA